MYVRADDNCCSLHSALLRFILEELFFAAVVCPRWHQDTFAPQKWRYCYIPTIKLSDFCRLKSLLTSLSPMGAQAKYWTSSGMSAGRNILWLSEKKKQKKHLWPSKITHSASALQLFSFKTLTSALHVTVWWMLLTEVDYNIKSLTVCRLQNSS